MEISETPIEGHTMYIKYTQEELSSLSKDSRYILANLELNVPMYLLLSALSVKVAD